MVCFIEGKNKMKKLGFKIWLFIIVFALALLSIFVSSNGVTLFQKGVLITSVEPNSTSFEQGLRSGQIIVSIDGNAIKNISDYSNYIQEKFPSENEIKTIIKTKDSEFILFSKSSPEITVSKIPKTSLKTGLDLSGGARAIISADGIDLTSQEASDLADVIENRVNNYGLKDIKVSPFSDLSGNNYVRMEIAGATPKDLKDMIESQGKFEAKIGEDIVFVGGNKDIASVCRNDATCAGIEQCQQSETGEYFCTFRFTIYLSESAARNHADITNALDINSSNPEYLSKPLDLYLDDKLVNSLLISKDLKGQVTTQISISGSGSGATEEEAYDSANEEMHQLQTVLITGSFPYELKVLKLDVISPNLGGKFILAVFLAGLAALISVAFVVFFKYRKFNQSISVLGIGISEIIITLGVAALLDINLDLSAIAGVLAAIGTGVNDQIVILDETKRNMDSSLKARIKNAFGVIMGAYLTLVAAMIPLYLAGGGLLKGFASTTIIGLTLGILVTRPAFSEIIKRFEK
jgi:preprotein translocase subunit SecD